MIITIFINWILGLYIQKCSSFVLSKTLMLIAIIYDILQLFVFKYLSFTLKNISFFTKNNDLNINILLPIGISIFTFQTMSYILDVYHKKAEVQNNFFSLALYISMFPQLIAGPIVRYETIANEINNRIETADNFIEGVERFIIGIGKKLLIANYVGFIADKTKIPGYASI
jgi:D-alanyl-lipoteichoic acid acyltransferase DltB (MBOAT superfamily)